MIGVRVGQSKEISAGAMVCGGRGTGTHDFVRSRRELLLVKTLVVYRVGLCASTEIALLVVINNEAVAHGVEIVKSCAQAQRLARTREGCVRRPLTLIFLF